MIKNDNCSIIYEEKYNPNEKRMNMKTISIGKYRGLAQVSTSKSTFSILALDHRNNLRQALNPENPALVLDENMVEFKSAVVRFVTQGASSIILDPEYSAAQCITNGSLQGDRGLICAVEATGYTGDPNARKSKILPGWNIEKAKRMGSSAIKLLIYYNPKSGTCQEVEDLIAGVSEDCKKFDMAFFLEPLSYTLVKGEKLSPTERRSIVIETAERLSGSGCDVLKVEFPLDITAMPDEKQWAEACRELSQASVVPWVLLSASVDFETYLRQVEVACQSGCSGVAAGRAVWKEAVDSKKQEARDQFLQTTARNRMQQLTNLCDQKAMSWKEFYSAGPYNTTWYQDY